MITLGERERETVQEECCPEYNLPALEKLLADLESECTNTQGLIRENTLADIRARSTLRALRDRRDQIRALIERLKR